MHLLARVQDDRQASTSTGTSTTTRIRFSLLLQSFRLSTIPPPFNFEPLFIDEFYQLALPSSNYCLPRPCSVFLSLTGHVQFRAHSPVDRARVLCVAVPYTDLLTHPLRLSQESPCANLHCRTRPFGGRNNLSANSLQLSLASTQLPSDPTFH